MIVPVIIRIINGKDGQGIDLAALFGPIFSLLAPFIGPVLAPIIGPLIRTISNPPTEGSSLAALITAIAGPLSAPQEPSGMSPLSIVIAGTTAALLRELKPGAPGGSDVGALIGSILSGVLAGTSAGLSGGSSGGSDSGSPAPYAAPVSSSTINVGFPGRPSPGPPHNPFSNRPSLAESTVHIGSTVRPSYSSVRPSYSSVAPTYPYPHHQATVATPTRLPSPRPLVQHHSGPVTAATGQDSYLPTGTSVPASSVNPLALLGSSVKDILGAGIQSVPASSVNPLALLGSSVKDILGAGIQVVSSLINAVFGILGASSAEPPAPTYGAPSGYGQASG
ncbi:mucin-19 [Diachasma alloeum]|uniref:mucin-19 n=1 Tax=Diachasma alloeum TaxID=454923 RepID=UPI0007384FA2|nr:mucin-19 [Diachasma alloeum]